MGLFSIIFLKWQLFIKGFRQRGGMVVAPLGMVGGVTLHWGVCSADAHRGRL